MKNIAIILAGGVGTRLGLMKPKQFLKIAGKTILEHTVDVFQKHSKIDQIYIIIHPNYTDKVEEFVQKNGWTKVKKILCGGKERYQSSLVAITACHDDNDCLIFHDAVRPLVSSRIIDDVIEALSRFDAVDVGVSAIDTIVSVGDDEHFIDHIPNRNYLKRGQTPQAFRLWLIKKAYDIAMKDPNFTATDDCGIVKKYLPNVNIYVVPGEERNIKLTYPEDIYLLDKLFQIKSMTINENTKLDGLNNQVLVIFGGNSGIGLEMANIAKQYGANVYSFSRSTTGTDITNCESVREALTNVYKKHGRIDYVVNSAAILNKEPLLHLDYNKIDEIININYKGVVNVTLEAYPYVHDSCGQILHFTSSSYTRGRAYYALYSSSKAAVVNFVQAVAEEWEYDGIRINCVNPQRTKTPMRFNNFGLEPEGTLLDPMKVANVALHTLLSSCNGEVVDVKFEND